MRLTPEPPDDIARALVPLTSKEKVIAEKASRERRHIRLAPPEAFGHADRWHWRRWLWQFAPWVFTARHGRGFVKTMLVEVAIRSKEPPDEAAVRRGLNGSATQRDKEAATRALQESPWGALTGAWTMHEVQLEAVARLAHEGHLDPPGGPIARELNRFARGAEE